MNKDCGCDCNNDPVVNNILGEKGDSGYNGWSPLFAVVSDGARRVLRLSNWIGGTGVQPAGVGQYLGASGLVVDIALAVDIRGEQGIQGNDGDDGLNGWSPILAIVPDPADLSRYVFQIYDWVGGTGTKPSVIDQYIGATGIVTSAAAAVNVRGPDGATGPAGPPGTDITNGRIKISTTDTTINFIFNKVAQQGLLQITKLNAGGNEILQFSVRDVVIFDQHTTAQTSVPTTYKVVTSYTTPNDGIARKYHFTYSQIAFINEDFSHWRECVFFLSIWINGSISREVSIAVVSSPSARSDLFMPLFYSASLNPNTLVEYKVKVGSLSEAMFAAVRDRILAVFGH